MRKELLFLTDDQRVHLTAYLHERSPELPAWQQRPAVVVLPGGGYQMTSDREADPVALAFLAQGFHAFVLRYSVAEHATYPAPLVDASRTLQAIRQRATAWDVNPQQIALCGFSAGGHISACLGTLWNDPELVAAAGVQAGENQPNALILCYPFISPLKQQHIPGQWVATLDESTYRQLSEKLSAELHVGPQTPPAFLFHTYQDDLVPAEHALCFAQALAQADIPVEFHLFQHGGHGMALGNVLTANGVSTIVDISAEQWFPLAATWLWRIFAKPGTKAEPAGRKRAHLGEQIDTSLPLGTRLAVTGGFSLETALGDVLDHSTARTVLERYLPTLLTHPIPERARVMPLGACLDYAGDAIPAQIKTAIEQELAALAL